jgi:hypothetical protein
VRKIHGVRTVKMREVLLERRREKREVRWKRAGRRWILLILP